MISCGVGLCAGHLTEEEIAEQEGIDVSEVTSG